MNSLCPSTSLLDDQVTLSSFDEWATAAYRSCGRDHQGLLVPYVISNWDEDAEDLPLLEALTDEWPGNVPAEVYCPYVAFNYLGTFTRLDLASALVEWPYDAVDLTALRLGAEMSQSDAFARHVDQLISALRFGFDDVCNEIHNAPGHTRLLSGLDQEALALMADGSLERALSDSAIGSGKLLLSTDRPPPDYSARIEAALEKQLPSGGFPSWRGCTETGKSSECIRELERLVAPALGRSVRLTDGVWRAQAAYSLPAPPPLILSKFDSIDSFLGDGTAVVLVPSQMTGCEAMAWVYASGSEYRLPSFRLLLEPGLFAELSAL